MPVRLRTLAAPSLAFAIALGACSSGSAATSDTTVTTAATTTTAAAAADATTTTGTATVNANTSSKAELTAAFEAAGISNAARWANEVDEYRPYATNEPSFARLRKELAKYNPGAAVIDKIIATLSL